MTFKPEDFFELNDFSHKEVFEGCPNVWDVLKRISPYLKNVLKPALFNNAIGFPYIDHQVYLGRGTVVEDGAMIKGPAIIGENCEIRHGAYIRGNVIIGNNCIVGNSCEVKNSILLNHVDIPHYNYVGDSILGNFSHLGAGAICSNLKLDKTNIILREEGREIQTGLRKFGLILGDRAQIGCNCVLNPGSIIGKDSIIYPGLQWRGILASSMIVKSKQAYEIVKQKEK